MTYNNDRYIVIFSNVICICASRPLPTSFYSYVRLRSFCPDWFNLRFRFLCSQCWRLCYVKKVTIIVFIGAFAAQDNNLSKHIWGKIWVEEFYFKLNELVVTDTTFFLPLIAFAATEASELDFPMSKPNIPSTSYPQNPGYPVNIRNVGFVPRFLNWLCEF